MRSLPFIIILLCKAWLGDSDVTVEGFGGPETGDYEMFATDDFVDQLPQFEFLPSDPLTQDDISRFSDPRSFNDISTSLISSADLFADFASFGCSSSDTTQDHFIGKRLDFSPEGKPQLCLPQRSNPGKYPGFDPDNDPLVPLTIQDPDDEEFCPRQGYLSSYLVCDSGYFIDRKFNYMTGLYNLDRCRRSTTPNSLLSLLALAFAFG